MDLNFAAVLQPHMLFLEKTQSINSATYMFVHVTKYARRHSNPAVTTILLEGSEKLFIRQSWELKWRFTLHCPTEKEYFAMVDGKTGAMFRLILRLMLTLVHNGEQSSENKSFDVLARTLGRWYQVRDEYLNLRDTGSTKKGFCEDLDDGKFSYPVVRSCADPGRKDLLVGILHGRDARHSLAA
ncbi:Geranylgeranyl pyrophosphate synthase [Penicillium rubens]|jgi:geranylgeranyl pyrophosphate synthase|nr:Geranylgeranyl pyrophosphate synthase [Penicillium rubens]